MILRPGRSGQAIIDGRMSTSGPRRERSNGNKRRSSDLLTIDELINRIGVKARSRGGRLFLSILGLAVAAIIVVIPLTRSAKAYSPAAKPQIPRTR